jgi:hypothetical protein
VDGLARTREANPAEAVLIRRVPGAEKPETQRLPLSQLMTGGSSAPKQTPREGDVIVVPGKKRGHSLF